MKYLQMLLINLFFFVGVDLGFVRGLYVFL